MRLAFSGKTRFSENAFQDRRRDDRRWLQDNGSDLQQYKAEFKKKQYTPRYLGVLVMTRLRRNFAFIDESTAKQLIKYS